MHPYQQQPESAFWSRAVSNNWNPRQLVPAASHLVRATDRIISAGSCFAANIVRYLEASGFNYLRTEVCACPETDRFGYGSYSAAFGNIYTARQMLQLVRRARGIFVPCEDRWRDSGSIIDPFRPGLPYPAENDVEFDTLTHSHLERTREAITQATLFIFTLGLTEAWVSAVDGAVYPVCPGTIAGLFDPERHLFQNFSAEEVTADLGSLLVELKEINPSLRMILSVSPVPLAATATPAHVLLATGYSKAVLRVACEEIAKRVSDVTYFPAYEIITGSQAPDYFEADRRGVTSAGIEAVMDVFFANSESPVHQNGRESLVNTSRISAQLSSMLVASECEEMMTDKSITPANRDAERNRS